MPNKQNARKALRQARKHAIANSAVKKSYKSAVKNVLEDITAGKKDLTEKLRIAQKRLDKAAKAGVIKKGTAARRFSRIMKKANASGKK